MSLSLEKDLKELLKGLEEFIDYLITKKVPDEKILVEGYKERQELNIEIFETITYFFVGAFIFSLLAITVLKSHVSFIAYTYGFLGAIFISFAILKGVSVHEYTEPILILEFQKTIQRNTIIGLIFISFSFLLLLIS